MQINYNQIPAYEWNWQFGEGDTRFGIMVRAHNRNHSQETLATLGNEGQWSWCMYAIFPQSHKLYSEVELPEQFDWHGGVTYDHIHDSRFTVVSYDWQKPFSYRKIGCDYQHWGDERFSHMSPSEGVPVEIRLDVKNLFEAISNA